MRKSLRACLVWALLAMFAVVLGKHSFAKEPYNKKAPAPSLSKSFIQDLEFINGNRIFNYLQNNGLWSSHNNPVGFSMQWPGESGNGVNFASGFWVAGKVNGDIRTAAAEFTSEWRPGPILADGTPADINDPQHRIFKINKSDLLDEGFTNPDYGAWINQAYLLGAPIKRDENGNPILSASGKRIPDLIGDQMVWNVYNDADIAGHSLFGSLPLGLECQSTIFVFNRPDEFGDMMFLKFLLVNKGGNQIDSAFVSVWFDIDLGAANDDLVFCDTTLSLGAFWNDGPDQDFPIPPAVGADFFQGPIVPSPGDTAKVTGRLIPGFRNIGMVSFAKYLNGGVGANKSPENAREAYNFMLGFDGGGNDIINAVTGEVTKFVNISDPETGTGWVDGIELASADRRMLMNSGPFDMPPWTDANGDGIANPGEAGTQEIVVGWMIAQGTDAKNSATQLKRADIKAQLAFDLDFKLPPTPPPPIVSVSNTDGEIVLTWEENAETYSAIDNVDVDANGDPTFYTFQGYNVYQVDSPRIGPNTAMFKVATFDIVDGIKNIIDATFSVEFGEVVNATVQRATDSGLQRHINLTTDKFNGDAAMRNWQSFWFVVTSYGVNLQGVPKVLESAFEVQEVVPQPVAHGVTGVVPNGQLIAAVGPDTTFNASHEGPSDGQLEVFVVDATKVTGEEYQITFEIDETTGNTVWNLNRGSVRLLSGRTNQSGDQAYNVVEGIQVKSIGPPFSFKEFAVVANAAGPLDPPEAGAFGFNSSGFPLPPNAPGGDRPSPNQQTNGSTWGMNVGGGNGSFDDGSGSSFIDRAGRNDNLTRVVPFDFEMRFTAAGGVGAWTFETELQGSVPFELWNIGIGTPDDPSDDYRMIPGVLNDFNFGDASDQSYDLNALDHPISGGDNDPYMDWVYWYQTDTSPGTAGYDAFVASGGDVPADADEVIARTVLVNWNGGSVSDPTFPANVDALMPEEGTIFRLTSTKPNTRFDTFTFSTQAFKASASPQAAQADADNVNVFPNPYFGTNRLEIDPVNRFVTFTHLPQDESVQIRIFTLSGERVALIDDAVRTTQGTMGTQTAQWNLRNDEGVPVASGMYIAYISLGSMGSKVLKLAIFQPQERLDTF